MISIIVSFGGMQWYSQDKGNGKHGNSDAAEDATSWADAQVVEERRTEQREGRADHAPEEVVAC